MDLLDILSRVLFVASLVWVCAVVSFWTLIFYNKNIVPLQRRNQVFREFCEEASDKRRLRILRNRKVLFSKRQIIKILFILAEEYAEIGKVHYLLFEQLAAFGPISLMLAQELYIAYDALGNDGLKEMEEILGYFLKTRPFGAPQETNSS